MQVLRIPQNLDGVIKKKNNVAHAAQVLCSFPRKIPENFLVLSLLTENKTTLVRAVHYSTKPCFVLGAWQLKLTL